MALKSNNMKQYNYKINGNKYSTKVELKGDNLAEVEVNGQKFQVEIEKEPKEEKKKVVVTPPAPTKPIKKEEAEVRKLSADNTVMSPLPGVIKEIKVSVGDVVKIGDTVVILEAMKMANNLDSEISGTVSEILVSEGESVMENAPLVVIE